MSRLPRTSRAAPGRHVGAHHARRSLRLHGARRQRDARPARAARDRRAHRTPRLRNASLPAPRHRLPDAALPRLHRPLVGQPSLPDRGVAYAVIAARTRGRVVLRRRRATRVAPFHRRAVQAAVRGARGRRTRRRRRQVSGGRRRQTRDVHATLRGVFARGDAGVSAVFATPDRGDLRPPGGRRRGRGEGRLRRPRFHDVRVSGDLRSRNAPHSRRRTHQLHGEP